jgi:hypothetical protein
VGVRERECSDRSQRVSHHRAFPQGEREKRGGEGGLYCFEGFEGGMVLVYRFLEGVSYGG